MSRDLTWKKIASEYLLRDTWATIRKDTCVKPDGVIVAPYYVYEFPDWVTAVAFTKEGKVILERQYRHALGATDYEIPGGCVDPADANYEEAIARELLEETGYRFERFEYLGKTSANPSTNTNLMHMFIAHGGELVATQDFDEGEDLEVLIVTLDECIQMLREGTFIQAMHVTALYKAFERLGIIKY